jgi:hypothetical protein
MPENCRSFTDHFCGSTMIACYPLLDIIPSELPAVSENFATQPSTLLSKSWNLKVLRSNSATKFETEDVVS